MKRRLLSLICAVCLLATSAFAVGCNNNADSDPNVLNVQIYQGGHGTEYIKKVADKFNELYKGQYEVKVLMASTELVGTTVYTRLQTGVRADVLTGSTIDATRAYADPDGRWTQVFADITDSVLNQPAISFDGQEENQTILEKLNNMSIDYTEEKVYNGRWYIIPYVNGVSGMAVNKTVLNDFNIEIPKTTNQLFSAVEKIMTSSEVQSGESDVRPFTYSREKNNYCYAAVLPWLAQYGGMEYYNQFLSWQKNNGGNLEKMTSSEAINLFKDEAVVEMMKKWVQLYDYNTSTGNSRVQTVDAAQNQFMRNYSAFYFVGDWMFNEEFVRNKERINNVTIVNTPVISSLGTKVFSKYGYSDEKCEELLIAIIDGVDAQKDIEVIKADAESKCGVTLQMADVERIVEARGLTRDNSGAGMFINNASKKKDLAALFLRFFASTDSGELVADEIHCSSPYAPGSLDDSDYEWVRSASSMIANRYNVPLRSTTVGLRRNITTGVLFPGFGEVALSYVTAEKNLTTIYNDDTLKKEKDVSVYESMAKSFVQRLYDDANDKVSQNTWKFPK